MNHFFPALCAVSQLLHSLCIVNLQMSPNPPAIVQCMPLVQCVLAMGLHALPETTTVLECMSPQVIYCLVSDLVSVTALENVVHIAPCL